MSLQAAYQAYQKGDRATARRLVDEAIQTDPQSEPAWVLKMLLAEQVSERQAAMERVLELNPHNETALKVQANLKAPPAPPAEQPQQPSQEQRVGNTYEMLWDCEFCGSKKLLGLTHRFCPNCGAPQNPSKRYFPSDEEKVAVKDHVYYGVDVICAACGGLNSAKAQFCGTCGAPLSEGKQAELVAAESRGAGEAFSEGKARDLVKEKFDADMQRLQTQAKKKERGGLFSKRNLILAAVIGSVILCCGFVAALLFWEREATVLVTGHSWTREIQIQAFLPTEQSDWCDNMPSDAYSVSRSERQRSSRQVPDGEDCRTVRRDNGDGTYSEEEVCTTRYREEPIYDDYCEYTVDRWNVVRSVTASGDSQVEIPFWPALDLKGGTGYGREREGAHIEKYVVELRSSEDSKTYRCEFTDQRKWEQFPIESRWIGDVSVVTGSLDCDSLKRAN